MRDLDPLEARDPEVREAALMAALPGQVAHAQRNAPGFARILAGVEASAVRSRAALARLPILPSCSGPRRRSAASTRRRSPSW
jgi:phenylacetate-CoA ligase